MEQQSPSQIIDGKEGYDVNLVEKVQERFKCPLCDKLMRDAIQTSRGELACESCYKYHLGNQDICPLDKEPITGRSFFKDKFKTLEILRLLCYCVYKHYGCPWTGQVATAEEHQSDCRYKPEICFMCNTTLLDGKTIDDHLVDCGSIVNNKGVCFYEKYGCNKKPRNVNDHIAHLKENTFIHSIMQNRYLERLESAYGVFRNDIECINASAKEDVIRMQTEITLLNGQVFSLNKTVKEMHDVITKLQNGMINMPGKSINTGSTSDEARSSETDSLSLSVANIDKKISELDLKQQLYENTTFNGTILWKIDNLKLRMQQALTGRVTALHSAPCFSTKYGYKFCGRVYLNGDGMGKCTHLSMFVVIMKSDYDNLSQWPFQKKVIFRLIDQEDTSNHIEESFVPDRFSSSFQKPKKDMNVAAGCPMFISKEDLMSGSYIKDDSIFLEINVV